MSESEILQTIEDGTDTGPTGPFIVGIGASAGGLEAISKLVANLPGDINACYVVVQHISPQHKSLLAKLIGRETSLQVQEVESGLEPVPNTIYVTPPNHDIVYRDGTLQLQAPSTAAAAPTPSIDRFFISMSEAATERAVGIVLSGTGSDGAYGIQSIRATGGIAIAQDDKSAKYDGMPIAAVETGCIDLVLGPEEIGLHLSKILTLPRSFDDLKAVKPTDNPVSDLLQILFARTRVDFREYKFTTVQRRVERRMAALGITDQAEYTNVCRSNPREVDALFRDLLISVTRFFRDQDAFAALRGFVDKMIQENTGRTLRIWVAGCATGEEAYSIAILLAEALGGLDNLSKDVVQIFASDIDADALRIARIGRYSLAALDDVPQDLISKYFVRFDDGVEVVDAIKQLILFSDHNVCQDPPFRNVDLVCCRNLLIYFGGALQRKVLTRLNYALNFGGILFLGSAETVAGSETLFRVLSEKSRIFGKRVVAKALERSHSDDLTSSPRRWVPSKESTEEATRKLSSATGENPMFDALARSIGRNTLLVSKELLILKVYGDISRYITLTENSRLQLSVNMLRSPLSSEARTLVTLAIKNGIRRRGTEHKVDGLDHKVQLEAMPLHGNNLDESLALLVFDEIKEEPRDISRTAKTGPAELNQHMQELERELDSTREALNQTIEELETSNEELQSLNEELQSTNEELQSLNEELETSNEELQSTNEELVTVNEELQVNAAEMSVLAEELNSILENIVTPIVVVDSALQITRVSDSAAKMFGLARRTETPHVSHCVLPPGFPPLAEMFADSLKFGKVVQKDIIEETSAYTVFCAPFSDVHGKISGATMILVETQAARLVSELSQMFEELPFNLQKRNADGQVLRISGGAAKQLGLTPAQAVGKNLTDLLTEDDAERVLEEDREFLASGDAKAVRTQAQGILRSGDVQWLQTERHRIQDRPEDAPQLYAITVDVSQMRQANIDLTHRAHLNEMAQELTGIGFWTIDADHRALRWSEQVYRIHGMDPTGPAPDLDTSIECYHSEDRPMVSEMIRKALREAQPFDVTARLIRSDGSEISVRSVCRIVQDELSPTRHVVGALMAVPAE